MFTSYDPSQDCVRAICSIRGGPTALTVTLYYKGDRRASAQLTNRAPSCSSARLRVVGRMAYRMGKRKTRFGLGSGFPMGGTWGYSNKFVIRGKTCGSNAGCHVQLVIDGAQMCIDRSGADHQRFGDLGVCQALGN